MPGNPSLPRHREPAGRGGMRATPVGPASAMRNPSGLTREVSGWIGFIPPGDRYAWKTQRIARGAARTDPSHHFGGHAHSQRRREPSFSVLSPMPSARLHGMEAVVTKRLPAPPAPQAGCVRQGLIIINAGEPLAMTEISPSRGTFARWFAGLAVPPLLASPVSGPRRDVSCLRFR